MSKIRPEALDRILALALEEEPDLERDLALLAAYHGDLSIDECAEVLGCPCQDVLAGVETLSATSEEADIVKHDAKGVARVGAPKVAVWEITREFRKVGSVSELHTRFPRLSESEIRAALSYCGRNPDEIAAQISAYEEIAARAKAAYPFA
jgi:uncharacterized protein (DUF433 family)